MKLCIACNTPLVDQSNFCPNCGADQKISLANATVKEPATFLVALCVLTILGSVFGIARGFIYEVVSELDSGGNYYRGYIYILTNIGTLVGAIIMLRRRLSGLYIYTACQIIYILTVFGASLSYDDLFDGSGVIASGISALFLVPSIVFLILYWLNMNRKHLS
jgi:hypothetical protein